MRPFFGPFYKFEGKNTQIKINIFSVKRRLLLNVNISEFMLSFIDFRRMFYVQKFTSRISFDEFIILCK